jgi:hypothetical protein
MMIDANAGGMLRDGGLIQARITIKFPTIYQ